MHACGTCSHTRCTAMQRVALLCKMPCWQVAITSHLDRAILTNAAWLRDSIGLWARFHALVQVGWAVRKPRSIIRCNRAALYVATAEHSTLQPVAQRTAAVTHYWCSVPRRLSGWGWAIEGLCFRDRHCGHPLTSAHTCRTVSSSLTRRPPTGCGRSTQSSSAPQFSENKTHTHANTTATDDFVQHGRVQRSQPNR